MMYYHPRTGEAVPDLKITIADILIDANQGKADSDRAFGFTLVPGLEDYCGMFFTWPRAEVGIRTVAEREAMLDSLEYDVTTQYEPHVPMAVARKALDRYLRHTYDLRRKDN
jgi:hypothetical protein